MLHGWSQITIHALFSLDYSYVFWIFWHWVQIYRAFYDELQYLWNPWMSLYQKMMENLVFQQQIRCCSILDHHILVFDRLVQLYSLLILFRPRKTRGPWATSLTWEPVPIKIRPNCWLKEKKDIIFSLKTAWSLFI